MNYRKKKIQGTGLFENGVRSHPKNTELASFQKKNLDIPFLSKFSTIFCR